MTELKKKNLSRVYFIPGIILIFFALKDNEFLIFYHGIALLLGLTAIVLGYRKHSEFKESNKQTNDSDSKLKQNDGTTD